MRRRPWVILGVVLAIFAGTALLRRTLGIEFDPESLQQVVADMGVWAPLAYVVIVTFRVPLGLPSAVVLVGGGAAFGTVPGTVYGAIGILVSAVFLFFAARATGREAILARTPARLAPFFELAKTRAGAIFLSLGTGYPFGPATMCHLIAGVTGMAFVSFVVAVAVGAVMRAAVYTFFGSRLIEGDLGGLVEATVLLSAAVVLPLLFPRTRAWLLGSMRLAPGARDA